MIVKNYFCNVSCKFLIKIESTWRHEIKEPTPQLTLLCRGKSVRFSHRRCSIRQLFLKIFTVNACVGVYFLKSCRALGLQFYKKETPTQEFSPEFLILPILKDICKRLLFNFFNSSLLHGPKGSRSKLYDGVRLQGSSHRFSFCF